MKTQTTNKLIAYLALISGLTLSVVAEYYSILGLTAIFSAAVIPVIIMGISLGVGKVTATVWLKQNWDIAPFSVRTYLFSSIIVLMLITAMGTFGFLSKAHSDQSLVSGDVLAKVAIYDEKIKTEQENIVAERKAIKQMDEAVDQVMGRSTSENGANQAVAIRRSQQKERIRLQADIATSQQKIANLNEARAPIAAEVRKVEAEVGPIKYIAAFVYGATDNSILEKSVTWMIIVIIAVFDPLAVFLLLASQISFKSIREQEEKDALHDEVQYKLPAGNPIPADVINEDIKIKQFFENGQEVARRLDAGESIEELPNVTTIEDMPEEDPLPEIDNNFASVDDSEHIELPLEEEGILDSHEFIPHEDPVPVHDLKEVVKSLTPSEMRTLIEELRDVKPDMFPTNTKTFDWATLPEGTEYVTIDGQKMSVRAGKALYPQTHYEPIDSEMVDYSKWPYKSI